MAKIYNRVAVYCGSSSAVDPTYLMAAREVGKMLAERGIGVVYGGGRVGLMGACADGALAAGGEVIGVVRNRRGSVGAHAAGVGAGVAIADALVILRHRERTSDCAVAQRHQAALWATEPLLEHDRPLCHQFANGGFGRGVEIWAFGHDDALAGCQAVELDDHRLAELAPPGDGLLGIG
mgnify:CR=1 FL=1